jgi:hypothetical protein
MPAWFRRSLLSLLGVAIALALVEAYLRTTPDLVLPTYGWKDIFPRPHEHNQLGFRGQRIEYADSDYVLLLVGDSQVEGDACALADMPEARLQHYLTEHMRRAVRVFSLGALGYGQDQQLLALEEYLARFRADAAVVWFTDGNDTWNNASIVHSGGWPAKPTFWLDARGALAGPQGRMGEPVYSSIRLLRHAEILLFGLLDDAWDRRLPQVYRPMESWDGPYVSDWKLFATPANEMAKERTALALALVPPSDRGRYAVALTNKLLHRMRDLLEARQARFSSFVVQRPDFPPADGVYGFPGADGRQRFVRVARARHGEAVAEVHEGIELVQLPVTVTPFCSDDDPHFNQPAVDQLMRDLAAALAPRLRTLPAAGR